MSTAYFYFTAKGKALAEKIAAALSEPEGRVYLCGKENFRAEVCEKFSSCDKLIFICAAGIAVRAIAPYLGSKLSDPAVVVCDQGGNFVISLLSGHVGGANKLAGKIGRLTGAVPVITTATDCENITAFDEYAAEHNMQIEEPHNIKYISAALVEGERVDVYSDLSLDGLRGNVRLTKTPESKNIVCISHRTDLVFPEESRVLYLRPKNIYVGTGCRKDIDFGGYEKCFLSFLQEAGISILSVAGLCTIKRKAEEKAINLLCRKYNINLLIVSEDEIKRHEDKFEGSAFVKKITGVSNVSETCAYIASGFGQMIRKKTKFEGITFAAYRSAEKEKE